MINQGNVTIEDQWSSKLSWWELRILEQIMRSKRNRKEKQTRDSANSYRSFISYRNLISSLAESFASSAVVTKKGNFNLTAFSTWTSSAATCMHNQLVEIYIYEKKKKKHFVKHLGYGIILAWWDVDKATK